MAALSGEQIAQLAYSAGFRGEALVQFVSIAKRESGWDPTAHRTDNPGGVTGDFGLWQINYVNLPALRGAGIVNNAMDLLDPVKNAAAAFYLSKQGTNLAPWSVVPGKGWQAGGNPLAGVNLTAGRQAVQNAQAQGLLGQTVDPSAYAGGAASGGTGATSPSGGSVDASALGPYQLPSDMHIVAVPSVGAVWAVYDAPGGVHIAYAVHGTQAQYDQSKVTSLSIPDFQALHTVDAGSANEIATTARDFGSFGAQWNSVVDGIMGKFNPARNDPGVQGVLAEFASRPDMSPAELTNKLQATDWYRTHTQSELEWNSLGPAEQQKRKDETETQMADAWWQFAGVRVDATDPRIANYIDQVASGQMGIGAFAEKVVKAQASADPTSPYSRQTADEAKQKLQPGVDIENTAQNVKDLATKWGVRWGEDAYQDWGRKITTNEASEADVLNALKQQAQVMYPWKDPNMDTATAAAPWIDTYSRVMERPGDLFNPQIQKALQTQNGTPTWQFEQDLKNTSDWLTTKNARSDMYGAVAETGRRMGFA